MSTKKKRLIVFGIVVALLTVAFAPMFVTTEFDAIAVDTFGTFGTYVTTGSYLTVGSYLDVGGDLEFQGARTITTTEGDITLSTGGGFDQIVIEDQLNVQDLSWFYADAWFGEGLEVDGLLDADIAHAFSVETEYLDVIGGNVWPDWDMAVAGDAKFAAGLSANDLLVHEILIVGDSIQTVEDNDIVIWDEEVRVWGDLYVESTQSSFDNGDISADGDLQIGGVISVAGRIYDPAGDLVIDDRLYVTGDVGIGTATPLADLDIKTAAGFTRGIRIGPQNATVDDGVYIEFTSSSVDGYGGRIGGIREGAGGANALVFLTGDNDQAERMRIADDGNVGIGTNNPQALLDVDGDVIVSGTLTANLEFVDLDLSGDLDVDGFIQAEGNILTTGGNLLSAGGVTAGGLIFTYGDLEVDGDVSFHNPMFVDGTAYLGGGVVIDDGMAVNANADIHGDLDVDGDLVIGSLGNLYVNGDQTTVEDLDVMMDLGVQGDIFGYADVKAGAYLQVIAISGAPPSSHCDAEAEWGRMTVSYGLVSFWVCMAEAGGTWVEFLPAD